MKLQFNTSVGTIYKKLDFGFCTAEIPKNWQARYNNVDGIDQQNIIFIFNPDESNGTDLPTNTFTIQYSDLNSDEKITPDLCIEIEEQVNPGGQKQVQQTELNELPVVTIITKNFEIQQKQCIVITNYLAKPGTQTMYRIGYWYDVQKEKQYAPLFQYILKSIKLKN